MTDVAMAGGPPASTERLHALDAVRAGALILGVFLHASMSFLEPRVWIAGDVSTSPAMNVTFFVIHIFRMTLFFLIAGFFGRMLLQRRGALGFVKDRAKRVLIPLVSFWPLVIASIVACAIWSFLQANPEVAAGRAPAPPPPPPMTAQTFPLTHLWFLYVLIIFYAAVLALRGLVVAIDRSGALRARFVDPVVRGIMQGQVMPIVFGVPLMLSLFFKPDWIMFFGVPTPDIGLVPNTPALIAYGGAFAFGWLLNRQTDLLGVWQRHWPTNLVLALIATAVCLVLGGVSPTLAPETLAWKKLNFAVAYVLAIWSWTGALIGLALRFLNARNPVIRYFADASYWIYIVHLPIVLALQVALQQMPWPWYGKYAAILAIAFPLMLITYHVLVRYSFVGAILNSRKQPRRGKDLPNGALVAAE